MDDEVNFLKHALRSILGFSGGHSTIKALEDALFNNYGTIDFQRHGANNGLLDFIKMFPETFSVSQNNKVSLVEPENPSRKSSDKNLQGMNQGHSGITVMDRFLADCAKKLQNVALKQDDSASETSREIQTILSSYSDIKLQNMTVADVQTIFKETNPFLEDVLQEYTQFDALGEFHSISSALKVESFVEDSIKCDESKEALSTATDYKEIQSADENIQGTFRNEAISDSFSDKDFEQLEKLRDGPNEKAIPVQKAQKHDSLDSLSSFNTDEKARKLNAKAKRSERKFDEASVSGVVPSDDHPVFYKHLPPHNRDQNLKLPEPQKLSGKFKIMLSHIDSPIHFWFQLNESTDTLIDLHEKIDDIYLKLKENELVIARKNIQKGLIVAAYHVGFKQWYRARITNIEKDNVYVLYLDYGTSGKNEFHNLRYLVNYFLSYPPLCYRGRTYGIMPVNNDGFSIAHRQQFGDWVIERVIDANCKYYDEEQDTYELQMTYGDGKDIRELLLMDNICKDLPERVLIKRGPMRPYFYELPSHELLENGDYPTYESIIEHERAGYYINTLITTNYLLNSRKGKKTPAAVEMLRKADDFSTVQKYYSS